LICLRGIPHAAPPFRQPGDGPGRSILLILRHDGQVEGPLRLM
jgi:hypothetical protein